MTKNGQNRARFVVCVNNTDYQASLDMHKIYRVVPDKDAEANDDIRIIDESGEDYLYSQDRFVPIRVPTVLKKSLVHAH